MDKTRRRNISIPPETPLFTKAHTPTTSPPRAQAAHDGAPIVVVEGYVDVIAMVTGVMPLPSPRHRRESSSVLGRSDERSCRTRRSTTVAVADLPSRSISAAMPAASGITRVTMAMTSTITFNHEMGRTIMRRLGARRRCC